MKIVGISCNYHDSAAALIEDGIPIRMIQEERLTRIKHDPSFPINSINYVIGEPNTPIDYVVFYESPMLKFERFIINTLSFFPHTRSHFREGMITFLKDKLWIKSKISESINVDPHNILFLPHHLAHASSSYFCSPFEESNIITFDGVGEWATTTSGYASDNNISIFRELRFPHSLGMLYSVFTGYLGFKPNDGEYKLMGLSPYGSPIYEDKIKKLIDVKPDGSYRLNMEYMSFHTSLTKPYNQKFIDLFGTPRDPKSEHRFDQRHADIASSIQKLTEEIIIKNVTSLYKNTHCKNLCIAGGVGLNSVANYKILQQTPIENIYIQPASGDSGGALGAALFLYYSIFNNKRTFIMDHTFYGNSFSNDNVRNYLNQHSIPFEEMSNISLVDYVSSELNSGKIFGWMQGSSEWGPRSLGHRSIIADARRKEMLKKVNISVKFRESFRPFAPSVMYEDAEHLFNIPRDHYPSRFMLYVCPVINRNILPSITHVDGSARPQVVFKDNNNLLYYNLLERFKEISGYGCFLNTSFNLSGEPIVETPHDAYTSFEKTNIDELVINNFVIKHQRDLNDI
jgi:carbamoyltransferase